MDSTVATPTFHRVVSGDDAAWNTTHAIMLGPDGDWCLYRWWSADKTLILDYFTREGEFVTWEGYQFGSNPLPAMFEDSEVPVGEDWIDPAVAVAA